MLVKMSRFFPFCEVACLVALGVLGSFQAPAIAQTINGGFHGTITDTSGAVIPGATVQVKNLSTNFARQAATNGVGYYTIAQLPPGHYSIAVSMTAFATAQQADVELLVNQDLEANYTLSPSTVTQEVEVTAAPPSLQTTSATMGQVVGSKQVVDLPLNGRQFTQLVLLTPGASPKESGQQSTFTIPIGGEDSALRLTDSAASRMTSPWTEF